MTIEEIKQVVPSGNGGINSERRTIAEICAKPVPDVLLNDLEKNTGINNPVALSKIRRDFGVGWSSNKVPMPSVNGSVDFSVIEHPKFKVRLPLEENSLLTMVRQFRSVLSFEDVTAADIRKVSYSLMRKEIAKTYDITETQAGYLIGAMDSVIHETEDGWAVLVPNNLHRYKELYSHRGYVSRMRLKEDYDI